MPMKDADGQVIQWFGTNTDTGMAVILQVEKSRYALVMRDFWLCDKFRIKAVSNIVTRNLFEDSVIWRGV
jgi:hypothetical protein